MFPSLTLLEPVAERPKGITPTGRVGGYRRWNVTEFTKGKTYYYKHQKLVPGVSYEERWYKLEEV